MTMGRDVSRAIYDIENWILWWVAASEPFTEQSPLNFNSFSYILLFLPVTLVVCWWARRLPIAKAPQVCILLASVIFYGWKNPSHLGYLFGSILVNWQIARWIGAATGQRRKRFLQLGLVLNIGFLGIFKYLNFFIGNIPYFVHHKLFAPDLSLSARHQLLYAGANHVSCRLLRRVAASQQPF